MNLQKLVAYENFSFYSCLRNGQSILCTTLYIKPPQLSNFEGTGVLLYPTPFQPMIDGIGQSLLYPTP